MLKLVCVRISNALEAVRDIKHLMGSLLRMLVPLGWVGQLVLERLEQTSPGPDIRCWEASVTRCLPGTKQCTLMQPWQCLSDSLQ